MPTIKVKKDGEWKYVSVGSVDISDNNQSSSNSNLIVQDEEPSNVPVGTVWIDTDEDSDNTNDVDELMNKPKAGFIYPLANEVVPEGFLLCDGAEYLRDEYPELFAAIGIMYGAGDNSTTFNVPDLCKRVPIGASENYELGSTGGEETHTLTVDEMPSHTHNIGRTAYLQGGSSAAGYEASGTFDNAGITLSTGGSQAHNNMQPYTVVNYIIATGKNTGISVQDVINGIQILPLSVEHGGTGATNAEDARKNLDISIESLGITPENIGAMKMELLWENANPNDNFVAQTININLSNYKMARVVFRNGLSFDYNILEQEYDYTNLLMLSDSTTHWGYRTVHVSTSGAKFGDGSLSAVGGTFGTNNAVAIPVKIYGIK